MDKKEARRIFRLKVGDAMSMFDMYGMGDYIPKSMRAIIDAAEELVKNIIEGEGLD